jgi:hypothetical protein
MRGTAGALRGSSCLCGWRIVLCQIIHHGLDLLVGGVDAACDHLLHDRLPSIVGRPLRGDDPQIVTTSAHSLHEGFAGAAGKGVRRLCGRGHCDRHRDEGRCNRLEHHFSGDFGRCSSDEKTASILDLAFHGGVSGVGVEPEKLHGLVAVVDVGVLHHGVGAKHIRGPGLLDAELRAIEGQAGAVDGEPYLFLAGQMRVRFSKAQRVDLDGDDVAHGGEAVRGVEEIADDMCPVAGRTWVGIGRRDQRGADLDLALVGHEHLRDGMEAGGDGLVDHVHRQVFFACAADGEGYALRHKDGDVPMQGDSLALGADLALTGHHVEDLLGAGKGGEDGGGPGGETSEGDEVGGLENCTLRGRAEVIAAGEDVPEDEGAELRARGRLAPVAEEEVDAAVLGVTMGDVADVAGTVEGIASGPFGRHAGVGGRLRGGTEGDQGEGNNGGEAGTFQCVRIAWAGHRRPPGRGDSCVVCGRAKAMTESPEVAS